MITIVSNHRNPNISILSFIFNSIKIILSHFIFPFFISLQVNLLYHILHVLILDWRLHLILHYFVLIEIWDLFYVLIWTFLGLRYLILKYNLSFARIILLNMGWMLCFILLLSLFNFHHLFGFKNNDT